jgi:hypothetical protein
MRWSYNADPAPTGARIKKVASVRIFGEILKREAIDDSDSLGRITEVAYEFRVRRSKTAPTVGQKTLI